MNDEPPNLKQDYRAIKAPPGFEQRVSARLTEADRVPAWWPRYAAAAAVLILALPLLLDTEPPARRSGTSLPSLSQLAPERPPGGINSLGSLRSVSLPAPPDRPSLPTREAQPEPVKQENKLMKQHSNKENIHG